MAPDTSCYGRKDESASQGNGTVRPPRTLGRGERSRGRRGKRRSDDGGKGRRTNGYTGVVSRVTADGLRRCSRPHPREREYDRRSGES